MIKVKSFKHFTVMLLESDDVEQAWCIPETANFVVVNNEFDTIDMYEMSEIKAISNAELFDYEKTRQIDNAALAKKISEEVVH